MYNYNYIIAFAMYTYNPLYYICSLRQDVRTATFEILQILDVSSWERLSRKRNQALNHA